MTQGSALGYLPKAPFGATQESLGLFAPELPKSGTYLFPEGDTEKTIFRSTPFRIEPISNPPCSIRA